MTNRGSSGDSPIMRAGQSARLQLQVSAWPSLSASSASARRWSMVRVSWAHTEVAISESRLSTMAAAGAGMAPCTRAMPLGSAVTLMWRALSAVARRSLAASGSMTCTAASTALMMRRRDQHCQLMIRSASLRSSSGISSPSTKLVRLMISATVCQSVLPSARSRATSGSRVSSASAWPTILLAAITDMFIAAETSAHVRVNPVINAYPGSSDDVPSASQVRCHNRAATAAIRREMTMDSSRWQSSISPSKAFGETMSNIRSIMPLPTDARRSYPQADFLEFRAVVPLSAYASQMNGAAYVGRVGSLAVALGVGAVLLTGPRVAWAETPGDSPSSPSSSSESPSGAQAQSSTEPSGPSRRSAEPPTDPASTPAESSPTVSSPSTSTPSASTGSTVTSAPPGVVVSTGGAHTSDTEETEEPTDPAAEPEPTANVHESVKPSAKSDTVDPVHPADPSTSKVDVAKVKVDTQSEDADESEPSHVSSLAAQTMSSAAALQTAATSEPVVPS